MITLSLLHPLNKTPVQHWSFEEEPIIRIGRSTDNHVVLYSAVVSRHHVELRQGEIGWEIVNLGTNGTYLEGKRVDQVPVKDGIIIRLARSGPNIQIHTGANSRETVRALMRLKAESTPTHVPEASSASAFSKYTEIHEDEDPLEPSPVTGVSPDEDTPTSGKSAQPD